jgi:PAS domain S-box-containing protein
MYRRLFHAMIEAFALHEAVRDDRGEIADFRFIEVNPEFEKLTGLASASVVGRTVREVFPDLEAGWLRGYARVARTGAPARMEAFSRILGKHLALSAFRVEDGRLAVLFVDVSERVRAVQALSGSEQRALRLIETLRRSESTLASLLDEKAELLKEVHHRVKNNLQVIVSLMNIERGRLGAEGGPADGILARMQDRVLAMAEMHEALYRSAGPAGANFVVALQGMSDRLSDTYDAAARGIRLSVADGELILPMDYAIPCCLAMNELLCNALRYAFPEGWAGEKLIEVLMDISGDGRVVFTVRDTGIGLDGSAGAGEDSGEVGGIRLARLLADQLDGDLEIFSDRGTAARLSFPLP